MFATVVADGQVVAFGELHEITTSVDVQRRVEVRVTGLSADAVVACELIDATGAPLDADDDPDGDREATCVAEFSPG